jgi:lipoprotein-anchoring transpeptidase ErfK/SrfK
LDVFGVVALVMTAALVSPAAGAGAPDAVDVEVGVDIPDLEALRRLPAAISYKDASAWVGLLNSRLLAAGFNANDDMLFGRRTRHAVYAFQKHHGLERDGVFRPEMWELLDEGITLPYRYELDRVEVDLDKQVLYLIEDGEVALVLPVSTGNGGSYTNLGGGRSVARTPEGKFAFQWSYPGLRVSYLGELWNPFYFWNGYAIHGSPSVPNHPASHGCIRTTFWDMNVLKQRLAIGQTVYVYGKRTAAPPRLTIQAPPPNRA